MPAPTVLSANECAPLSPAQSRGSGAEPTEMFAFSPIEASTSAQPETSATGLESVTPMPAMTSTSERALASFSASASTLICEASV